MEEYIELLNERLKKFSPYVLGGVVGSIVHRLREKGMSLGYFIASMFVSMFVSLCVGIICKDYFEIKQDTVIYVLTGISGVFSKDLLDEIQEIIKELSTIFKNKFGK